MSSARLLTWLLSMFVACSVLEGCAGLCVGGVCVGAGSQPGVPLLYADAGVRIERPREGVLAYQAGMALQAGDVIQTTEGKAVIDFDDGNIVALGENSRIEIGSIKLFFGEIFARLVQVAQRGGGQVITDEVSTSVTGTEYDVRRTVSRDRAEPGRTTVIVRNGTVSCEDRGGGGWPAVSLTADRMLTVDAGRFPRPPQHVNALAETAWADEVIKRLLIPRPPPAATSMPTVIFPFPWSKEPGYGTGGRQGSREH